MTKMKICGLMRQEDVSYVNEVHPEYVGFVFAPSRRQVKPKMALTLRGRLHPDIETVGVFVNESPRQIAELCDRGILDAIQLHGDEDAAYIENLRILTDKPIIKAVRVRSSDQVMQAQQLPCDFLLLDTYKKDAYGGSGEVFDLKLVPQLTKPYFLAGGLTPENVKERIRQCTPYAVDISSGVEGADGYKDLDKIRRFTEQVRGD